MVTQWSGWGASVRGPLHIRRHMQNQDAWMIRHAGWGELAVVCDGMGSCLEARKGSRAACRAVASAARMYSLQEGAEPADLLRLLYMHWRFYILPVKAEMCRTTCLFALCTKGNMLLAQLGDGMVVACHSSEPSIVLQQTEQDFSNLTTGLGELFHPDRWKLITVPEQSVDAVLLATDGIADDIVNPPEFSENLIRYYNKLPSRRRVLELHEMLCKWPVPSHQDDKTLACLVHHRN